jgi:hypothetical protein
MTSSAGHPPSVRPLRVRVILVCRPADFPERRFVTTIRPADHSKLTFRVRDDNGVFAQTFGVLARGMNDPSMPRASNLH